MKFYYAFLFYGDENTTLASHPEIIAGGIYAFECVHERNDFVKNMNYTNKSGLKKCIVLPYSEAIKKKWDFGIRSEQFRCNMELKK